jgi:hypothetical protein
MASSSVITGSTVWRRLVSEKHIRDRLGGILLLATHEVPVDVLGDGHRCVTEHLGDLYDSGVVTVPSDVRRLLGETRYELFAVDGSQMGTLAFSGSSGWGLTPFINRRGVDIGDFIVVSADTDLEVAVALAGSADLVVAYEEGEGWGPLHHLEAATEPDHAA